MLLSFLEPGNTTGMKETCEKLYMKEEKNKTLKEGALEGENARSEWSYRIENEWMNEKGKCNGSEWKVCGATVAALLFYLCLLTHPTHEMSKLCFVYLFHIYDKIRVQFFSRNFFFFFLTTTTTFNTT